jgi:predicted methyltransferase
MCILSHFHVAPAFAARQAGCRQTTLSLDLGLTTCEVEVFPDGIMLPSGTLLAWDVLHKVQNHTSTCFVVRQGGIEKVQRFSSRFNLFYSLMPTAGAPTLLAGGFTMHRIAGIRPEIDTERKLRTIGSCRGTVLDTTTGLGYTAIAGSRTAQQVITIERDPVVLDIARMNPWSRPLFERPNIQYVVADAYDYIQGLEDATFRRIIHDPPTFSLAGQLYSGIFYRHAFRVLRSGGRMFHYIGDLQSRSGGRVMRGVVRRLKEAGFECVVQRPEAFGLVAYKA